MASIANITFACADPAGLARFWAAALNYQIQEAPPGFLDALEAEGGDLNMAAAIIDPEGKSPRLFFLKKEKSPTTSIPIHLDLHTDDPEQEIARLTKLGASIVERKSQTVGPYTSKWTVMKDPEGNGFCVQ